MLKYKFTLSQRQKQKYLSTIVNRLLRHVDAMQGNGEGRTPVVLVGEAKFNPSQRGNRAAAPFEIVRFLSTKFPVFYIDEYNTSQLCPKCFQQLKVVPRTRNRHWICSNVECMVSGCGRPFLVHKDKSAAMNMFLCMVATLMCGKRPMQFRRPEKHDEGGDGDSGSETVSETSEGEGGRSSGSRKRKSA